MFLKDHAADSDLAPEKLEGLRAIHSEIQKRVLRNQIDYEFLLALPLRIGFLKNQDSWLQNVISGINKESIFYDIRRYFTHDDFMRMVWQITDSRKSPIFQSFLESLTKYPRLKFVPVSKYLDYKNMNALLSQQIWPLGITDKAFHTDGLKLNPFEFAIHDINHAAIFNIEEPGGLSLKFRYQILKSAYRKINEISQNDKKSNFTLNFLLFHAFHENSGISMPINFLFAINSKEQGPIGSSELIKNNSDYLKRIIADFIDQGTQGIKLLLTRQLFLEDSLLEVDFIKPLSEELNRNVSHGEATRLIESASDQFAVIVDRVVKDSDVSEALVP
jgi:hypothetical protein